VSQRITAVFKCPPLHGVGKAILMGSPELGKILLDRCWCGLTGVHVCRLAAGQSMSGSGAEVCQDCSQFDAFACSQVGARVSTLHQRLGMQHVPSLRILTLSNHAEDVRLSGPTPSRAKSNDRTLLSVIFKPAGCQVLLDPNLFSSLAP
jgi:hypothetical protein